MKKWIFIVIGILIVGFVGYQFYASKSKTTAGQSAAIKNRTATVQKGKFEVKVSGTGAVKAVTDEDIKSNIDNNAIDEVLVSTGESVTSGEELITFTDGSDPITAPADGVITTISVTAGERVQSEQVVAHLTNYKKLKTVASIDELDIPNIKVGQAATIKVNALPNQTFTGKVTGIANEGTSTNGVSTFDVDISIDNQQNLKVGMSTETGILTASKKNALYVQLDAVHSVNGEKYVLLASENTNQSQSSHRVTVKTGLANEDYVEITQGLAEGQTVSLPNLAANSTTSTTGNSKSALGGMGGMTGGMGRQMGGFSGGNAARGSFGGKGGN